jgi:hypothetical protein
LNARVSCCNEARERVVSGDEAVADREKSVLASNTEMVGQPRINRVPGGDKKVVPAAMNKAAFEARYYAAAEKTSGAEG